MSTIGHPLSDLSNLLTPFYIARLDPRQAVSVHPGFLPRATRGLPHVDEITELYFNVTSPVGRSTLEMSLHRQASPTEEQERRRELAWAQAFNIFRLSAICQGIAARVAGRQASSAEAKRYGDGREPLARFAWKLCQDVEEKSPRPRI